MFKLISPFPIILLFAILQTTAQQSQLDAYIEEALESNIALQRRGLSYEKSLAALREAKAKYMPSVALQARFSVAQGGRAIEIPVGDLVNPVYDNLDLLNSYAQDAVPDYPAIPDYPDIENERENFLRETEQETFVRVSWPVFNSAIIYNHRIQENLSGVERVSVDLYKRELVREVKKAYFDYLKTVQGVALYENTLQLVEENLRTSESLYRNHQVTIDEVYASRAQMEEVEQQLARVRKQERTARAYFNFLLNRSHETEVVVEEPVAPPEVVVSLEQAFERARQNREEFQQLNYYLAASDNRVKMERGDFIPTVNLVGDVGIQGINYGIDRESGFVLGSVVLRWNIFDHSRKSRVQQAQISRAEVGKQKEETAQQINLEVVDRYYELEVNRETIESARAEVDAAQRAFRLIEKKYGQGQANQVELVNARTQMTNAERRLIIARYDYQISLADFERALGTYSLE